MTEWVMVPYEMDTAMWAAADDGDSKRDAYERALAARPPLPVAEVEALARVIYDKWEGAVANQDFGRQSRQWVASLDVARAVIAHFGGKVEVQP